MSDYDSEYDNDYDYDNDSDYDSEYDSDLDVNYEDDYKKNKKDKKYKKDSYKKTSPEIPSPSSLPQKKQPSSKKSHKKHRKKHHKKHRNKNNVDNNENNDKNDKKDFEENDKYNNSEYGGLEEILRQNTNEPVKIIKPEISTPVGYIPRSNSSRSNSSRSNSSRSNSSRSNSSRSNTHEDSKSQNNQIQQYSRNAQDYGNSTKASIIVEAKKEYTLHLHLLIDSFFCDEFETLYQHCIRTVKPPDNPINDFLKRLKRIPISSDHYKSRILDRFKKSGGDEVTLLGILKALFISHVQLLLSIRIDSDKKAFQLDIPPIKDFLFQCMIEIAKGLYELYTSNSPDKSHHKNTIIIKESIEQAVTKHIPIKQILFSFRDNPDNPNNITVIPCTPIVNSSNSLPTNRLNNATFIRSPVVNSNWVPPSTPALYSQSSSNNKSGAFTQYHQVQQVNLKSQKVNENATLTQVEDELSEDIVSGKDSRDKHGIFNEIPSPSSSSKNDESSEYKTIKTKNSSTTERQGSKEFKIAL